MGEQGCLTNEKFYNLEVSNNLQVNKFTDKIIYDFQKITSAGTIDLNKPLIIIDTSPGINLIFEDGMDGQMIMLINYGSNVNLKKENGDNHEYRKNDGSNSAILNGQSGIKLIWYEDKWFQI
tara:strand:+ start:1384 stop:1749 length:366 start_codon:yes stop_codon:yes gene_type:complete